MCYWLAMNYNRVSMLVLFSVSMVVAYIVFGFTIIDVIVGVLVFLHFTLFVNKKVHANKSVKDSPIKIKR